MVACPDHVSWTHKNTKSVIIPARVSPRCSLLILCVLRASQARPDCCHPSAWLAHNANLLFSSSVKIPPPLRRFCYPVSVSPPLPIPHLPPLFSFFLFLPFLLPVKCFVCHDFPCSLSERRQCASPVGTGPQFPRQLYNCFGCVPSATGYRGIIDVKRNMYETRTCERPPYGSVHSLTRGHLSIFQ